jgi:hypothetical protein
MPHPHTLKRGIFPISGLPSRALFESIGHLQFCFEKMMIIFSFLIISNGAMPIWLIVEHNFLNEYY